MVEKEVGNAEKPFEFERDKWTYGLPQKKFWRGEVMAGKMERRAFSLGFDGVSCSIGTFASACRGSL